MARSEQDREDLLREATALVERAELTIAGGDEPVVVGFRRDGSASFYFGADPVYQFNRAGELRRAYIGGLLYKAERGRLVSLRRERSSREVALVRGELTDDELAAIMAAMAARLGPLRDALSRGSFHVVGQVPNGANVVGRTRAWLTALSEPIPIASGPSVL